MDCPFIGMDPWLESAALWPEFHNRLISSISDASTARRNRKPPRPPVSNFKAAMLTSSRRFIPWAT